MKLVVLLCTVWIVLANAQSATKLNPGVTLRASTARDTWSYFYVELSEATINYVSISSLASSVS